MALSCIAAIGKKEATERAQSAAAELLAPESGVEADAARAPLPTHCFAVFAPFRKIAQLASVSPPESACMRAGLQGCLKRPAE